MYCPHCGTTLPERPSNDAPSKDPNAHRPVQALSCPNCEAAIRVDDRRGVIPIDAPIVTILVVYK